MSTRIVRRTLLILLLSALTLLAWLGLRAYQVQHDLQAASEDATGVQTALAAGDDDAADAALQLLTKHSASAASRSTGWTWGLLVHLPVVGDDARGAQVMSDTLSDLTRNGVAPLTASAGRVGDLLPRGGRIDISRIKGLQVPVEQGRDAFTQADRRLRAVDPTGFVTPLRLRYRDLADRVGAVAAQLDDAETALRVMPGLLGDGGSRDYLLVVQNNAEVRSTGGLPGAVSLVRVADGRITLVRQAAGSSFGQLARPVLPLTSEERAIYGSQLGRYFVDANFTPDVPRAAALMAAQWERDRHGSIDGVVSLDPVTLSYLLEVTGPVSAAGRTLSADNAVAELLHNVYLRLGDPQRQDAYLQQVTKTLFDRLSSGTDEPEALLQALARGVREGRVTLTSFHPSEQRVLADRRVAGALVTRPTVRPQVGFYVDDATGAKMSFYLRFGVTVRAKSCRTGRQALTATAELLSKAPPDAASLPDYVTGGGAYGTEPGAQLDIVRIFGPVAGTVTSMTFDGRPLVFEAHTQDDRPVAVVVVYLEPDKRARLTWSMSTGAGQTGDVDVSVTPGIDPVDKSSTARSACD